MEKHELRAFENKVNQDISKRRMEKISPQNEKLYNRDSSSDKFL
jgi:hypothetical protein